MAVIKRAVSHTITFVAKTNGLRKPIKAKTKEELQALAATIPRQDEDGESLSTVERYRARVNNRSTAIRAKCIECSCGSRKEVADCHITKCALWPFRMGKDPFRAARNAERAAAGQEVDDADPEALDDASEDEAP